VVVSPEDYSAILEEMQSGGGGLRCHALAPGAQGIALTAPTIGRLAHGWRD